MDITLIIPAYNEEANIAACLHAAKKSTVPFTEIIVVDNACTDRTAEIANTFQNVRVVREDQKGLTHARQAGFSASTTELIAYIDADSILPEWWAERGQAFFERDSKVVAVSGIGHYYDATPVQKFLIGLGWWISAPILYPMVGYMIYGAHFMVRRSALEAIGGFNKKIEFYGEDTDLARRLSGVGKVIFRMDFYINTSARRFQAEGIAKVMFTYSLNFVWPVLFGKPYTSAYKDHRS